MIKCTCEILNCNKYKNNWCLLRGIVTNVKEGDVKIGDILPLKGVITQDITEGELYNIMCEKEVHEKYGVGYKVYSIYAVINFDTIGKNGSKKFIRTLVSYNLFEAIYDTLEEPFNVFNERDIESLCKVPGIGEKTAIKLFDKFHTKLDIARIYMELEEFNLTDNMIKKLMDKYNSPDVIVDTIKDNPYVLCTEIDGIGWKTADKIALSSGIPEFGTKRVGAFILYYLGKCGEEGQSWITTSQLMSSIYEELTQSIPKESIKNAINFVKEKLWISEDKKRVGLMKYYRIEEKIAKELLRLKNSTSSIQYGNWEEVVKQQENEQGWEYTEEQIKGIQLGIDNNVMVITGGGGTGKTSLVSALLKIMNGYSFVQTALAGKAASNLQEVTGEEGYTIHRLLGYPNGKYNGFVYSDKNKLPYDIYLIDEISMVDLFLFYSLIRSIPSGSKLFMLGDIHQLESIGAGNIAKDMIESSSIPTVRLNKIHRQASKSAIITESIKVRDGQQLIQKDWEGCVVRGELKDLILMCQKDDTIDKSVLNIFKKLRKEDDFNILETQVIVPMKTRGKLSTYNLNTQLQNIYNPKSIRKEIQLKGYTLRVGDKVINIRNNYKTDPCIYNGNIGILKSIDKNELNEEYLLIDFVGIGEVKVLYENFNDIELAYALTTHKMQGSSADNIIYAFDNSAYILLTREQVYTGITRAKKKCYILAQTSAVRMAVAKQGISKKQTHLKHILDNEKSVLTLSEQNSKV